MYLDTEDMYLGKMSPEVLFPVINPDFEEFRSNRREVFDSVRAKRVLGNDLGIANFAAYASGNNLKRDGSNIKQNR